MKPIGFLATACWLVISLNTPAWPACGSRHKPGLDAFALSPDGRRIAALAEDGTLFWWDVSSRKQTELQNCLSFAPFDGPLVFSSDSHALAIGDSNGYVRIFDLSSGKIIHSLQGKMHEVRSLVFSGDGLRLAAAHDNGVTVWSITEEKEILFVPYRIERFGIALNNSGTLVATEAAEGINVWDVDHGKVLRTIRLQDSQWAEALLFVHSDKWIVSELARKHDPQPENAIFVQLDHEITIWNASNGNAMRRLELHEALAEPIFPLMAAGKHWLFLSAYSSTYSTRTETLTQWNLDTGKFLASWHTPAGIVAANGKLLLHRMGPPGRLGIWRIGGTRNDSTSFNYRSSTCDASITETADSSKLRRKFELTAMFDGLTEDRIRWGGRSYTAADCSNLSTRHIHFPSPERAHSELQRITVQASTIVEKGPREGHWTESLLGDRAVLLFHDPWSQEDSAMIVWTDGSHYFEISSWSLSAARDYENQIRE